MTPGTKNTLPEFNGEKTITLPKDISGKEKSLCLRTVKKNMNLYLYCLSVKCPKGCFLYRPRPAVTCKLYFIILH